MFGVLPRFRGPEGVDPSRHEAVERYATSNVPVFRWSTVKIEVQEDVEVQGPGDDVLLLQASCDPSISATLDASIPATLGGNSNSRSVI